MTPLQHFQVKLELCLEMLDGNFVRALRIPVEGSIDLIYIFHVPPLVQHRQLERKSLLADFLDLVFEHLHRHDDVVN
jgi:hypothetical protein